MPLDPPAPSTPPADPEAQHLTPRPSLIREALLWRFSDPEDAAALRRVGSILEELLVSSGPRRLVPPRAGGAGARTGSSPLTDRPDRRLSARPAGGFLMGCWCPAEHPGGGVLRVSRSAREGEGSLVGEPLTIGDPPFGRAAADNFAAAASGMSEITRMGIDGGHLTEEDLDLIAEIETWAAHFRMVTLTIQRALGDPPGQTLVKPEESR